MKQHNITMLGSGLIADFYTMTLHGQRNRDRVQVVYSRSAERGEAFRSRHDIPESSTDMEAAINHADTDVLVLGTHWEPCANHVKSDGDAWRVEPASNGV